jgi:hypothetical protein
MIVQICAARKVRAAVHSGHAASPATALLLKVKNPKAPAVEARGREGLPHWIKSKAKADKQAKEE